MDTQLQASYLPGVVNTEADRLSCLFPHHEWRIAPRLFHLFNKQWGPHSINQTATTINRQLLQFNSQFSKVGSKGTDCLLQDWSSENNWSAPPIVLIPRILDLVERQ